MTMRTRFLREVSRAGLPIGPGPHDMITEDDLTRLPEPTQRYLRFMRVLGRPRDWSFRLGFSGRFRIRPGHTWMTCETWQYNTRLAVARIFHVRVRVGGVIPVLSVTPMCTVEAAC